MNKKIILSIYTTKMINHVSSTPTIKRKKLSSIDVSQFFRPSRVFTRRTKEFRAAVARASSRLVGSCLVITRQRTGTMAILVVSERVSARLWNIRSRKNTKCFADYSRCIDDSTSARRLQTRYRQSNLDPKGDRLFTSRSYYIATKSILSATTYTEFLIFDCVILRGRVIEVTLEVLEHRNTSLSL